MRTSHKDAARSRRVGALTLEPERVDVESEQPHEAWLEQGMRWDWYKLQAGRRLQRAQDAWLESHGIDPADWVRRRSLGMTQRWPTWREKAA